MASLMLALLRSSLYTTGWSLVGRLHHLWRSPAPYVHPILRLPQSAREGEAEIAGEGGGTGGFEEGGGRSIG